MNNSTSILSRMMDPFKRMWSGGKAEEREQRSNFPLREAIDMVVSGTDPRIRGVSGYGKKLKPAVEQMLAYLHDCSNWFSPSIEISTHTWNSDPLVRALFATPAELRQPFSRNKELRAYFQANPECQEAYVGLSATRQERKTLGMEMLGETIRRDVEQTTISFTDYSIFGACGSEKALREHVVRRGFGFLVGEALEQIIGRRAAQYSLEEERHMLTLKLKSLEHKRHSAESLFQMPPAFDAEIELLRERVQQCQQAYGEARAELSSLEDYIQHINNVLAYPENYLHQERLTLHLNSVNIKVEASDATADAIVISEVAIGHHYPRVVVLARFARADLLPEQDFAAAAERLLGITSAPIPH